MTAPDLNTETPPKIETSENQNSTIENPSDAGSFLRLARLSTTQYDSVRRAEAKRLALGV